MRNGLDFVRKRKLSDPAGNRNRIPRSSSQLYGMNSPESINVNIILVSLLYRSDRPPLLAERCDEEVS
jgi:hypothetical protein